MISLPLHEFHARHGAVFAALGEVETVAHYGDAGAEHAALFASAGLIDLSFRSRLWLTGADRLRFLNGQVTNNVKDLAPGQGCYAALVTAKGRLESDLNVICLEGGLLLDFEPGLSARVAARLEKYIIADDVQVADVAPHYGLLAVQGPRGADVVQAALPGLVPPEKPLGSVRLVHPSWGEVYCVSHPRGVQPAYDLYVPTTSLTTAVEGLLAAVQAVSGRLTGWEAWELARLEAGIPRFGADMDETNLAPEAGLEARAINYSKGCYIGQEVIARIRTYGQVARALRGLRLADDATITPRAGDKLFAGDKEVGHLTSVGRSLRLGGWLALGYVRKEHNQAGTELTVRAPGGEASVRIVDLPFQ